MVDPFAPTALNTGCFRWQSFADKYEGLWHYSQINFILSGTLERPPATGAAFFSFVSSYIESCFEDNIPVGLLGNKACLTLNVPAGLLRYSGDWTVTTTAANYLPANISCIFSLYTADPSRSGRGIFRYAPVLLEYSHGNYLDTSLGGAAFAMIDALTIPQTLYGLTLTPCVWSRTKGTFQAITEVIVRNKPSRLSKRRIQKRNKNPWMVLPNTW